MSGLTSKPLLHTRPRRDGTHQVRVRLTLRRVVAWLDAGFALAPRHWNPRATLDNANWVRATEPDCVALNGRLESLVRDARRTAADNPQLSAAEIRDRLADDLGIKRPAPAPPVDPNAPPTELAAFARWYVRGRAKTDKPGTVLFYHNLATHLEAWRALPEHASPVVLSAVREEHLRAFYAYLVAKPTIYAGTAADHLVKLSTVVRHAIRLGMLPAHLNPFNEYTSPKCANKQPPRRPTEAERLTVLAYDMTLIPAQRPTDYATSLALRRDVWALQYLTRGTRFRDVALLRERDVRPDRIAFVEAKTGKHKNVARTTAINAILGHYPPTGNPLAFVLPLLDHTRPWAAEHPSVVQLDVLDQELRARNQWVNNGLRALAELVGVPAFTTHSARHMYTERAYTKTKDLRLVQAMLNHSDLHTTERYLKSLGHDALDAATDLVLSDD